MSVLPAITSWQTAFAAQPAVAAKQAAFQQFLARGLPTARNDAWKYTDLRRLAARTYVQPASAEHASIAAELLPESQWHRLVFVDGQFSRQQSTDLPVGVTLDHQDLPSSSASFDLLNVALSRETTNINVAANAQIDQPIYIAHYWSDTAIGWMRHPRVAIRVANNAQVTIVEHFAGNKSANDSSSNFSNAVTAVQLAANAQVTHVTLQEDASSNFHVANLTAQLERDAHYAHHHYVLGSSLARTDIHVQLGGEQSRAELSGLVFARNSQHLDVRSCIEHQMPNTSSDEEYRGIAADRGRVVFNGKVIVAKDAQKTDARQSSPNLLLSPTAEIDTRPELEIYANDVKCAHGATVGKLDEAALFFLRSRGLDLNTARALLTQAFAASILNKAPLVSIRERVLAAIAARLQTGGVST